MQDLEEEMYHTGSGRTRVRSKMAKLKVHCTEMYSSAYQSTK